METGLRPGVYGYAPTSGVGVKGSSATSAAGVYGFNSVGPGVAACGGSYDFYSTCGVSYISSSSVRWKKNIIQIDNALDKVLRLRGVYYDTDQDHGNRHDMGFIGEEVAKVLPEITAQDPDAPGYVAGIDYSRMTPVLLEAIKAQQKQIADLTQQVADLKKQISRN